jgi:transcriptional regulator with XRE-family HTH domain
VTEAEYFEMLRKLGNEIRNKRIKKGLAAYKIAKGLGTYPANITSIEKGVRFNIYIKPYCNFLGVEYPFKNML